MDALSLTLTPRQQGDVELILNDGFSPLRGFLNQDDYESVVETMHLKDGTLWPIPVNLDVNEQFAARLQIGMTLALYNAEGILLAWMTVTSLWRPDKRKEARLVYGTDDIAHLGVRYLLDQTDDVYLGGDLVGTRLANHYDFTELRHTPQELRNLFRQRGWSRVIAFQTRNPMHKAHYALTLQAMREHEASLLIHPSDSFAEGDVQYYARVRSYQAILAHYPAPTTQLSLFPIATRMAGPREAIWHAIINHNYGCSHMIIGRDHAGPTLRQGQTPFYSAYQAQELFAKCQSELPIQMIPMEEMVYVMERSKYVPISEVLPAETAQRISGTELRRRFAEDLSIPDWFSFPQVVRELRWAFPPKHRQGLTVLITGLPSAGKTTLAHALYSRFMEIGTRRVSILDGDQMRQIFSSELGFSNEDREKHMLRMDHVAREITKNGGIAILALVAPLHKIRRQLRDMIAPLGGFIEVYINTALEVCEQRDRKGLYAKARKGLIPDFTGVSGVYEVPEAPEVIVDGATKSISSAVEMIVSKLQQNGYIQQLT